MNPWSTWSVSAFACFFYLCGWAFVSKTRAPVAQPATTYGKSLSASPGTGRGIASYAERRLRGLRPAGMLTMPDAKPEPESGPQIDEGHMAEWLKFGFAEMHIFMLKHAQFDAYYLRNRKPEEPDGSASSPES